MTNQTSTQQQASRAALAARGPMRPSKIEKASDPRKALVRLIPYLSRYKAAIALVGTLILVTTGLDLLGPYLMGRAIDQYIGNKQLAGLAQMAVALLVVYITNQAFQALSAWTMARVSQNALKDLRRDLFTHLQELSLKFFDTHNAGELMSRLTNDIDAINQAVSQNVIARLGSVLSLVGFVVAMFVLNFWLALASVIVVPIMVWFTDFIAKSTRKGFRDLQKSLGELNGVMEESISGQRVVKAFRRNETSVENFRRVNADVFKAGVFANTYAMMLMPLTNQLGNLFVIVLAGLGGWLALRGLVTVGDGVAVRVFVAPRGVGDVARVFAARACIALRLAAVVAATAAGRGVGGARTTHDQTCEQTALDRRTHHAGLLGRENAAPNPVEPV